MPYVGNQPSGNFVQVTSQTITGNGGATYTLDRPDNYEELKAILVAAAQGEDVADRLDTLPD